MNTLFISPAYERGSYNKITNSLLESFKQIPEINLIHCPISYEQGSSKLSIVKDISWNNIDTIIQYCLPKDFIAYKDKRNIFYCNKLYPNLVNVADIVEEVWVPTEFMKNSLKNLEFSTNIHVVPYTTNNEKYLKRYSNKQIEKEKNNDFLFYNISHNFSRRKNYLSLIKAFHSEFSPDEPVNLVVKIHKQEGDMSVREYFDKLKVGLNLHKNPTNYRPEILLPTDYISDEEIDSIHYCCDCFVSTSYEETLCIPSYDAVGFGKTPIVCGYGGYSRVINDDTSSIVDYSLEPIYGLEKEGRNSAEYWGSINIQSLRKVMREIYENRHFREEKSQNAVNSMLNFSHNETVNSIKGLFSHEKQERESREGRV